MARTLPFTLLALLTVSPAWAADKMPTERTTNDRQIIDTLAGIHDRGAALFNSGDTAGCYRLFQGSLQTVRLVLVGEVKALVERGLSDAERTPDVARRALMLHEVIEAVRVKLRETAGPAGQPLPIPRTAPGGPPVKPTSTPSHPMPDPSKAPAPLEISPAPPSPIDIKPSPTDIPAVPMPMKTGSLDLPVPVPATPMKPVDLPTPPMKTVDLPLPPPVKPATPGKPMIPAPVTSPMDEPATAPPIIIPTPGEKK